MAEKQYATLDKSQLRELFDRANRQDLEAQTSVRLTGGGRRRRAICPVCGQGDKLNLPFSYNTWNHRWNCFSRHCEDEIGGDLVALVHFLTATTGESKIDTAKRMVGDTYQPTEARSERQAELRSPVERPADPAEARKAVLAADLWREAVPASGTLVATYWAHRAPTCPGWLMASILRQVRFHPRAFYSKGVYLPAMVALVRTPTGPTGGVHVTYLATDGRGKTDQVPAKKMWGAQAIEGYGPRTAAGDEPPCLWGGVWLTHPEAEGPLIEAEGLESAVSAAILVMEGRRCRVVAALTLGRLAGGWKPDKWGRYDPKIIKADPAKPAFTWPEPPDAPWGEVMIAVDRDMSPLTDRARIKVRKATGGTYRQELSGEDRARISGALASQSWARAGAKRFRCIGPGPGRDFNDELLARVASGELGQRA